MTDYTLFYWPIPFRGQFIRAVLSHVGATWEEAGYDATFAQRAADTASQLIPHMGPPVLTDHSHGIHISQMPAILTYLGEKHGLIADDPMTRAMTHKVIADANDVLYEMTRFNGSRVWTTVAWRDFLPRLARWMDIFEVTGGNNGLTGNSGHYLGTTTIGLSDLVVATLWGTMTDKIPSLRPLLDAQAPAIAGLCDRVAATPAQRSLKEYSNATYGDVWCGGDIEASLRTVV